MESNGYHPSDEVTSPPKVNKENKMSNWEQAFEDTP